MKQHITESPEWNRFYWAVMAIAAWVILSCLFSCTPQTAQVALKKTDDWIAQYWFVILILSAGYFVLYRWRKNGVHLFFACIFLIAWLMPYLMMFGVWAILQLF